MTTTYQHRRDQLEEYFDRTAHQAWAALTAEGPVSHIRATVRAGRTRMRDLLLGYLPNDLTGQRLLDAGCGTGSLSELAARRGAQVVGVDVSPSLVSLGRERMVVGADAPSVELRVGDMRHPGLGAFDWVVAMDSLIHYSLSDVVDTLAQFAPRVRRGIVFTFAPRTPALTAMHALGRVFPRGDRAPDIVPLTEDSLRSSIASSPELAAFRVGRTERVASGFYTSQAMELVRA
jgi:magnesium-protoporphyrin O-methyltransferase